MSESRIADKLKEALLGIIEEVGMDLLKKSTEVIQKVLNCTEVSLWTINRNDTQVDGKTRFENVFLSTSLISRTLDISCQFNFNKREDFSHDLSGNPYFKKVLLRHNSLYFRADKEMILKEGNRSADFIYKADINDVITIPITQQKDINGSGDQIIAILELSYSKEYDKNLDWDVIASILHNFISSAFKHYTLIQQQNLIGDLIQLHDIHKNDTVQEMFADVIKVIQKKYCPCQGASFFMWDSFYERYVLISTTGLLDIKHGERIKEEIYYMKGEGLTGKIGQYEKLYISDDLYLEGSHTFKTSEEVVGDDSIEAPNHIKTGMFIPISYPNNSGETVGVLRLINKTNPCQPKFVDYFNYNLDGKAMEMASKYLSLVCDFYIKQDEQGIYISKMAHELNTPANAICKSSELLYNNVDDKEFLDKYLKVFLSDIRDLSQMQKWQVATNLRLLRNRNQLPFDVRYNLKEYNLFGLVQESKAVAIPIARKYNVSFANIHIDASLKRFRFNVDKNAFITLFYNLLTNAIKYHDQARPFYTNISGRLITDGDTEIIRIIVEDHGIGISEKEKKAIFEIGYRGKNALMQDAHGYGIGLPVIKQIIEDFGGKIYISSYRNPTIIIIDFQKNILI